MCSTWFHNKEKVREDGTMNKKFTADYYRMTGVVYKKSIKTFLFFEYPQTTG